MKRILSLLLAALLLAATAACVPQVEAVEPLTVSGPLLFTLQEEAYGLDARIDDHVWLDKLAALISGAQPVAEQRTIRELLSFQLEDGSGSRSFRLWAWDSGYMLSAGNDVYSFDGRSFLSLLDASCYQTAALPAVTLEGAPLLPAASSLDYRAVEGWRSAPWDSAAEIPLLPVEPGEDFPLPQVEEGWALSLIVAADGEDGEEEVLYEGRPKGLDLTLSAGQRVTVTLEAAIQEDNRQGSVTYRYSVESAEPAAVAFSLTTMADGDTDPGELMVLRVHNLPQGAVVGVDTDLPYSPSFFDDGEGGKIALLPVSYFATPGPLRVSLFAAGESREFTIQVRDKEFDVQHLTVDPDTTAATIDNTEAVAEYNRVIASLMPIADGERHWEGRFILPVDESARVTTTFGLFRYTNGSQNAVRHEGVDLALPEGSRVEAAAAGRVVYAGYLQLTGWTVLIEHGYGLKTWYYHMYGVEVAEGDMVAQGQKIGEVGSTGFSTGPHLHLNLSIGTVYLNPYTAIETDLLVF